jgi:hypothetical protein
MNMLVVARTRMSGDRVCVGGIELGTGRSLRLLGSDGNNLPEAHSIRPGTIWDIACEPLRRGVRPPHVEDVIVTRGHPVEDVPDMKAAILGSWQPWECPLEDIFDGPLDVTERGTAFLRDRPPLPSCSTGFWHAQRPATLDGDWGNRYWFAGGGAIRSVKYSGMSWPPDTIPAGALIRFSLARWAEFPPGVGEKRCYLQVSGWYR